MKWIIHWCLPAGIAALLIGGCLKTDLTTSTAAEPSAVASIWNLPGNPPYLVAHYMPWFKTGDAWDHWRWTGPGPTHDPRYVHPSGERDIASVEYPLIGPYNSADRLVIRYHLQTAKAAGISAFAAIWYGPGSSTDLCIPVLLDEAQRLDMRIAICYEEKLNFPGYRFPQSREDVIRTATADLRYILTKYGPHPAYLKRRGVPFVFQFNSVGASPDVGPHSIMPSEWRKILADLPPVVYGRQNVDESFYPPLSAGFAWWSTDLGGLDEMARRAAALCQSDRMAFYMGMICPGFDDTGVWGWGNGPRVQSYDGTATLRRTMDHALVGEPELVQIVTWNDLNEGTAVEPTVDFGFAFLDEIEKWWSGRIGRKVDLADNREPYRTYVKNCSAAQRAMLPVIPEMLLDVPEAQR